MRDRASGGASRRRLVTGGTRAASPPQPAAAASMAGGRSDGYQAGRVSDLPLRVDLLPVDGRAALDREPCE